MKKYVKSDSMVYGRPTEYLFNNRDMDDFTPYIGDALYKDNQAFVTLRDILSSDTITNKELFISSIERSTGMNVSEFLEYLDNYYQTIRKVYKSMFEDGRIGE